MNTAPGSAADWSWGTSTPPLTTPLPTRERLACNGILAGVFDEIDVLVCPSMTTAPERVTPEVLYGPMSEEEWTWGRFTIPFDFNGERPRFRCPVA